jgi:hypothetical protein
VSKLITKETLKKWDACKDDYDRFNELFPDGACLQVASDGLISEGKKSWSDWLWVQCKNDNDYMNQTVVVAGHDGTAKAGYGGTATADHFGTAMAGEYGTAKAGHGGTAMAGHFGTATADDFGTAKAGHGGTAKAGHFGTAKAGDGGTAMAGYRGTVLAGEGGMLVLKHWTGERCIVRCANVGIDGIEPNTPYRLSDGGERFVKVLT